MKLILRRKVVLVKAFHMTKKGSYILLISFAILMLVSISATYYKYVVMQDFVIINDVPEEESDEME
jgi:hypothetical protein